MRQTGSPLSARRAPLTRPARFARTEVRRALDPVFSAFDTHLAPRLGAGALLAVSGGPDSRALLECVARWPGRKGGDIHVACVAHGHRRAAVGEAELVAARARTLGFFAIALRGQGARADEATLRALRYRQLADYAAAQDLRLVVTAHHRDDIAEGAVLDARGQGGGPDGAAMSAHRVLSPACILVRPLLGVFRETLRAALTACRTTGVLIDDADRRGENARARVRSTLAGLAGDDPNVRARLAQRAQTQQALQGMVAQAAAEALMVAEGIICQRPGAPAWDAASWRLLWRHVLRVAIANAAVGRDVRGGAAQLDALVEGVMARRSGKIFAFAGADATVTASGGVRVEPSGG